MSEPTSAQSAAEQLERGTLHGWRRRAVRTFVLGLLRLVIRVKLVHLERVPATGGVLVVANHLHNADPILTNAAYPRPLHYMAKKEVFGSPIFSWFLRKGGAFSVDRGKADRNAIKSAQARLAAGIAVGIYPEGTRSPTRSLQKAHSGAGMLALAAGVPVQPVVITGSERLPLNGSKAKQAAAAGLPWPRRDHTGVRILFGEPFFIPREIDGRRITSDEATEIIMVEIARLLPPDYRGVYRDALAAESTRRAQPLPFPR
jgi:1-acyl-sn-glycerol-3-phosphate acyltransferase